MSCAWCGGWQGVREVHTYSTVARCNAQSPFDPSVRCRRERGHLSQCVGDAPAAPTWLCYRCWGIWAETGARPPAYRMRDPVAGPITGRPLDLRRLL